MNKLRYLFYIGLISYACTSSLLGEDTAVKDDVVRILVQEQNIGGVQYKITLYKRGDVTLIQVVELDGVLSSISYFSNGRLAVSKTSSEDNGVLDLVNIHFSLDPLEYVTFVKNEEEPTFNINNID